MRENARQSSTADPLLIDEAHGALEHRLVSTALTGGVLGDLTVVNCDGETTISGLA